MTIDYSMSEEREKQEIANDTLSEQCGTHKTEKVGSGGTTSYTYLYQSDYRGNVSKTVGGLQCLTWGDITMKGGKSLADVAGDSAGQYLGLYYQDNINKQHNFCRNPMIKNVLAKTDDDVRKRAWCVTYKNGSSPNTLDSLKWEYCDVPYCRNDTKIALKEQAADANNTVFPYTTCEAQKDQIFGNTATPKEFTLWRATEVAREEAYFSLEESAKEMDAQYKVIQELFNETNDAFDKLKNDIVSSIASGSEASKFDNYRNIGTIVIVCLCMLSACLAVAGVCMGYCNLTNVPPHLRTSACSLGGRLIKISSYWAAMMAIINLYMATIFFLPGALFSLVCTDFENNTLFDLFDHRILVNYSILGRAILGNDTYYDMTFNRLYNSCEHEKTLWVALALNTNPDYKLSDMIQVNETLDVNYTYDRLRDKDISMDFTKYPMFPKNLQAAILKWNISNGTQVPWRTVKDTFKNTFMGAAKGTLESDDNDADTEFCKQFNKWASDVDAGVTGNTLECRVNFTKALKDQCDDWVNDYDDMDDILNKMRPHVNTIEGEWNKYGDLYMLELLNEYNYTNMNLMYTSENELSRATINETYSYWQKVMNNEVGCYAWLVNDTMINNFTMCYPIYKIIRSTMDYFCKYMVTTMTLAWMSQGLIGFILALHMLVANSLSTYFIKMEVRHPDDISKEEIIAGFK